MEFPDDLESVDRYITRSKELGLESLANEEVSLTHQHQASGYILTRLTLNKDLEVSYRSRFTQNFSFRLFQMPKEVHASVVYASFRGVHMSTAGSATYAVRYGIGSTVAAGTDILGSSQVFIVNTSNATEQAFALYDNNTAGVRSFSSVYLTLTYFGWFSGSVFATKLRAGTRLNMLWLPI